MDSTFLIICLAAVFSESVEGLKTESRDKIVLLGDRVELDCITNSSHPVEWSFLRPGSSDDEVLAFNSQLRPNISDSYSIVTKHFGQVTLVIDPLLAVLAGRYKCLAMDDAYKLYVQVTALGPTPSCDENAMFPSQNIVCSFRYAGNLAPELEWQSLGNNVLSVSCNASSRTVDCAFENSCAVNNSSTNDMRRIRRAPPLLRIGCEDNSTCQWGDVSSSVGILQVKGYNMSIGGWQCNTTVFATTGTSAIQTIILVPISVGVTTAVVLLLLVLLLLVFLHKKYGICRMKRKALDVPCEATTDEPVCSQVLKKKKEDPVQTQTGFIVEGTEELYGRVNKGKKEDPIQTQTGFIVEGIGKEELYGRVNKGKKEDPVQTQTGFIVEGTEELYSRIDLLSAE